MVEKIYRIKVIEHHRVMDKETQTVIGYLREVCVGEAGLEAFVKRHDNAIVEANEGHIVRCIQNERISRGGLKGWFLEFIPEEILDQTVDDIINELKKYYIFDEEEFRRKCYVNETSQQSSNKDTEEMGMTNEQYKGMLFDELEDWQEVLTLAEESGNKKIIMKAQKQIEKINKKLEF